MLGGEKSQQRRRGRVEFRTVSEQDDEIIEGKNETNKMLRCHARGRRKEGRKGRGGGEAKDSEHTSRKRDWQPIMIII